jgi:hypothetical protein
MSIAITCPACSKSGKVPDYYAGKTASCPTACVQPAWRLVLSVK